MCERIMPFPCHVLRGRYNADIPPTDAHTSARNQALARACDHMQAQEVTHARGELRTALGMPAFSETHRGRVFELAELGVGKRGAQWCGAPQRVAAASLVHAAPCLPHRILLWGERGKRGAQGRIFSKHFVIEYAGRGALLANNVTAAV